jgi:hypothetical protein
LATPRLKMLSMHPFILALAALAATASPAPAQDVFGLARQNDLWGEQQMARQRDIRQTNDLNTLKDRLVTDQQMRDLALAGASPPVNLPPGPVSAIVETAMPSIPDAELAASRARVMAASQKKH